MTNKTIAALTAATTPLVGTELVPVWDGATKRVTVDNLTKLRTVSVANLKMETTSDVATAETSINLGICPSLPTDGGAVIKSVRTATSGANHKITFANVRSGVMNINMEIDENGNVVPLLGNVQFATAAKGINFTANTPAAGMTSQLLNWYEEGTFTPTVRGSTVAGTGTYTAQVGKYTRIGNLVTFHMYVVWSATTGTGNLGFQLVSLPTSAAGIDYSCSIGYFHNITLTANNVATAIVDPTTNNVSIYQYPIGGGASTAVPIDAAGSIEVSGSYIV